MAEPKSNDRMEKIVSLCKRRGFIFQSSEIYGGLNGFWDYGPLGAELKRNIKDTWWRAMTHFRDDVVGLEATIIMHPTVWRASGHVDTFADLMVEDPYTNKRYRADQVEPLSGTVYHFAGVHSLPADVASDPLPLAPAAFLEKAASLSIPNLSIDLPDTDAQADRERILRVLGPDAAQTLLATQRLPFSVIIPKGKSGDVARKAARSYYQKRGIANPGLIGEVTEEVQGSQLYSPENGFRLTYPRPFNLMLQTYVGPIQSPENIAYLRPETAQAIFVQFKNVLETSRQKVPFGIAQAGKAFRNEVTPRNFTFRSREFEQMELEFFIRPDEVVQKLTGSVATPANPDHPGEPQPNWGWQLWHKYWVEERIRWYQSIGLPRESLVEYWQKPEELAHYAKATVDILFKFPFGDQELEGIAARGDFDLTQHQKTSGKSMEYFDEEAKSKYVPHVIEPSAGVDRLALALICNAYCEEEITDDKGNRETRVVMKFHPRIAPIKVGVFPLLKNRPELVKKAIEVRDLLRPHLTVFYDEAGAIGRRYRRQDEAGTPFGLTIDFDTLGENGSDLLNTVTLRDRDSMQQTRVKIEDLLGILLPRVR
jgi:glycyl-tRNA synthetase